MSAARNETEACQLVLRADEPVAGVVVSASGLRLVDASATLKPALFKIEYVPNVVRDIAYPDPLPPLKPLDLQPNQAQPVWISVKVPKEAKAGNYAGTVRIEANGRVKELPLRLHVWTFALPDMPSSATAFGLQKEYIALQHGVSPDSPQAERLYAQYYEMLLDHGVSASQIPVDVMSDRAAKYLNDPRLTSFQIPYPADDAALKATVARLVKHGWFSKGYFYPIDEPVNKPAYDELTAISDRLHRCAPGYHWVVPFYRGPDWDPQILPFDLMANRVNLWCPNSAYFEAGPTRATLARRHRMGECVWWYVCCGPGEPFNNFFVNMSAMSHRILFWQQKRENVDGLLYWSTNYWNPAMIKDPWTDIATVKDINKDLRGDGSLLYPGKRVGVEGPVSSIRLEMIRDGLEDFDYLTLADTFLGKKTTQDFVARIATGLTKWQQDPLVLEKARRELGNLLERAIASRGVKP